jgi:LPS-assembly protein
MSFSTLFAKGKAKWHLLLVSEAFSIMVINVSKLHLLLFSLWATALPLAGQEPDADGNATQPELSSNDPIVLDEASGQLVARGKARLEYDNLLLLADEIKYTRENGQTSAKGNVVLTFREFRILADEIECSLGKKTFSAKKARFGRYPLVGESESLEGSLLGISTARNATLYLFEPNEFEPNFAAGELTYDPTAGVFRAKKVRLRLGSTSLFGIPRIENTRRDKSYELRFSIDHADHLGTSAEIGALFSIRPQLKLGGYVEGFTKRGLMAGPEVRYGQPDDSFHGTLASGFIHDEDPIGFDVQSDRLSDSRGFTDWSHRQRFNENLSWAAQVQWRSDSEVLRDFREEIFHESQWDDTFTEFTYSKNNFIASLFARTQPNDFSDQIERLPEIGLLFLPTELSETGIYHSFGLEVADLEAEKGDSSAAIAAKRAGFTYQLTRRFQVARWFSIKPSATYRMAHYWDVGNWSAFGADDSLTRHFGELGLDARIPFHATFDLKSQLWEVDGLRHLGAFLFQYRYLNDSNDGDRSRVPLIDRRYFDPNLRPLDLGEARYLDQLTDRNLLRIGIENRLQTRAKDYGSRDLAAFRLYQDLLLDPEPAQNSLDEFFGEVEIQPAPWLGFGLQAKWDTKEGDLQQLALETILRDGDLSEVSLSILRLEDLSKQYRLLGLHRLNERKELQTGLQFDAQTGDLTRATMGILTRISDSFDLLYQLSHRKGTAREDDLAFRMGIRILAF